MFLFTLYRAQPKCQNQVYYFKFIEGEQILWWRPKRDIYSIMYILFFDRKSGQYVSKHHHFTMVWYYNGGSLQQISLYYKA